MRRKRVANGTGKRWIENHIGFRGEECLIWPFACDTPGYGQFNDGERNYNAHRYMCIAVNGEPPSATHEAAHSCGNRRCVNPKHLSWETPAENQKDRAKHGTFPAGRTKLSPTQVEQIRQLKGKETSVITAAKYGVTESNVRLIQDGKTWKSERKHRVLFTPDEVRAIRQIGRSKPVDEICRMFRTNRSAIERIRAGTTYRHVRI